jgi:hypothetical protein
MSKRCKFAPRKLIDRWCNGNTADFDSAFQGSNPCRSTAILESPEFRGFLILGWL